MRKFLLFIFILGLCFIVSSTSLGQISIQKEKLYDSLKAELLGVYDTDQTSRLKLDSLFRANPKEESPLKQSLRDSIDYYDSINLIKVTQIISKYGWLSEKEVGDKANRAIFLVIQHAPFTTQKKLIPVVEKALKEGRLKPSHYALFKDRVLLRQGHKQIYGSQISYDHQTGEHFVAPLEDPDHVDERRKSVGLGSLADYVKLWGMTWNVSEYKKKEYPNLFVGVD
jgi:hypothetical protein